MLAGSLRRECEIARSARALAETQAADAEKEKSEAVAARMQAEKRLEEITEKLAQYEAAGSVTDLMKREAEARQLLQVYAESNSTLRAQSEKQAEDLMKTEKLVEELEKQAKEKESLHALAHTRLEMLEKKITEYQREKEQMEKELKEVSEKEKRASTQILDLQKKNHLLEVEREKILADRKSAVSQSLPSSSTQPQTVKSPQSSKSQSVQVAKVSQPIQNPPSAAPLTPNPVQSPVVTSTAPPSKSNQNSVPVSNPVQSQSIRPAQTQPAQIQTPKPTQIQTPKSVQSHSNQSQPHPVSKLSVDAPQFAPARLFQGVLQAANGEVDSLKRQLPEQQQSVGGEPKKPNLAPGVPQKKEEDVLRSRVERFQ